jgi:hypothetical protein
MAKQVVEVVTLQRIINKTDYTQLTSNKLIAQEIFDKITNDKDKGMNETLQREVDDIPDDMSLASERQGHDTNRS